MKTVPIAVCGSSEQQRTLSLERVWLFTCFKCNVSMLYAPQTDLLLSSVMGGGRYIYLNYLHVWILDEVKEKILHLEEPTLKTFFKGKYVEKIL